MEEITCFKAYDVRGTVPDQLNVLNVRAGIGEKLKYRVGELPPVERPHALAHHVQRQPRAAAGVVDREPPAPDLTAAGVGQHAVAHRPGAQRHHAARRPAVRAKRRAVPVPGQHQPPEQFQPQPVQHPALVAAHFVNREIAAQHQERDL